MDDRKDDITYLEERGEIARDEFVGRFTQDNKKLNYYDPIKRQPLKLFQKKTTKKKHSIPEDEGQSFTDIFAMFDERKLDLCKIMDYCVTSKLWAIVNKDEKSRNSNKRLFENHLQNLSPIPKTHKIQDNISTSIVDAMRAIRMISVADLKPHTFKSRVDEIINYLSLMAGNNLHVIFDNYSYEYSVPSKHREASQMERVINSLNQDLSTTKEWNEFLMNYKSKLQIVNLLVDYIKLGRIRDKAVIVHQGSECFL